MKRLIALGLIALSMNVAHAADGSFTGTIDLTQDTTNLVNVERVESKLKLEGRNERATGGIVIHSESSNQPIILQGRRD